VPFRSGGVFFFFFSGAKALAVIPTDLITSLQGDQRLFFTFSFFFHSRVSLLQCIFKAPTQVAGTAFKCVP